VQGREHPEDQAGRQGEGRRKRHDPPLQREGQRRGDLRRQRGRDRHQRPLREEQPGHTAQHRQQHGFGHQLREQVAAPRTDREPHGHFGRAPRGPREQQVHDVRAGYEQYDPCHRHQKDERHAGFAVDGTLAPPPRLDVHFLRQEPRHRLLTHPGLQRRFDIRDDRPVDGVHGSSRLLDGHARLQAAEQVGPVGPPVVEPAAPRRHLLAERDRHEDLRFEPERGAAKAAGRHADDRQGVAVHGERLVEDAGVPAEPIRPVGMAEDDDRLAAGRGIVAGSEQAPERRLQAQHAKVRPRHQQAVAAHRMPAVREVGAEPDVRRDPREHRLCPLQIAEHRMAEHRLAITGLPARLRPGLGARGREIDQFVRVRHRQCPEQRLVEERENGGVGPNPEAERQHGDRRDERGLQQATDGEFQIRHDDSGTLTTVFAAPGFSRASRPVCRPRVVPFDGKTAAGDDCGTGIVSPRPYAGWRGGRTAGGGGGLFVGLKRPDRLGTGLARGLGACPSEVSTVRRIIQPLLAVSAVVVFMSAWPADLHAQRRVARVHVVPPAVVVSAQYSQYYRPFLWQRYPYPYPYPYHYAYRIDYRSALRLQGPRDAEVYVDGYYVGTVDDFDGLTQRLYLEPGEHEIAVFKDGHRTRRELMLFRPGETYRLRVGLEALAPGDPSEPRPSPATSVAPAARQPPRGGPPTRYRGQADELGTLSIRVQPADAEVFVFIDGEQWDWPADEDRLVVDVPEGTHRIEVQREGHQTYSTTVSVRRGQVTPVNVSLPRQ
jgi:hypothetical protein